MAIEEVIGPETADQTAARDTREFWASVEGSTVKESAEFKAAQLVAEENTRFLLQEMAKEGVTVSEMKRDEYLKKSRDHAAEPFVPKQKYPEVVTDWGKPKDEVTILPETERTEISAIDSIKNVLVSSADSENAKKYAGLQNASVDTLMGKWRD